MERTLNNYSFLESFLEKCGDRVVFLCGDVSREFCEEMANVAKSMKRETEIFEVVKEQHRKRLMEATKRKRVSSMLSFLTKSKTISRFILRFIQTKADKEVIESVRNCDAVVWVGLGEDFDVFYLVDRRLVDAIMDKSFLLLSFPSKYTAEKFGINYDSYWKIFLDALNYPWEKIKTLGEELKSQLSIGNTLNVKTPSGTNFTMKFKQEDIRVFYGIVNEKALNRGKIQLQLPAGELFLELKQPEVNGKMVFDVPCLIHEQILSNVKITVENGRVIDYQSEKGEEILQKIFERKESRDISELGFGLNPAIKPCGSIYLDEKAYKTIHIGFGKMKTLGHIDFVMLNPTVYINGKELIWRF